MKIRDFRTAILVIPIALGACGETGIDPEGPNMALLLLQDDQGRQRQFYLGGYHSLVDCADQLQYEIHSASGRNGEFWTDQSFDYGGVPQEGWIRHKIVGASCEYNSKPGKTVENSVRDSV